MPWLRDHLKPVPLPDERRIAQQIADLDSDTFAVREKMIGALTRPRPLGRDRIETTS
jgi:hypothetical protein